MNIEHPSGVEFRNGQTSYGPSRRHRSSIAFPHSTLKEAVAVARAIFDNVGTGTCSSEQIAHWVRRSPKSSQFRSRLAAIRIFGLVDDRRYDAIFLTEIGRLALDQDRGREGRARAFLSVPLFAAVYERFKGRQLPPPPVLERGLIALGVADGMTTVARRMLERSAEEAGFYEAGPDRLVTPGFARVPATDGDAAPMNGDGAHSALESATSLHPLIQGLLNELPGGGKTTGGIWPDEKRKVWLSAAESIFRMMYPCDTGGSSQNR